MLKLEPIQQDGCLVFPLPQNGYLESFTLRIEGYACFFVQLYLNGTIHSQQNKVTNKTHTLYLPIDTWLYDEPLQLTGNSVEYRVYTSFPCQITAFASIL